MLRRLLSEPSNGMPELSCFYHAMRTEVEVCRGEIPGGAKQRHARVGSGQARRAEFEVCLGWFCCTVAERVNVLELTERGMQKHATW